MANLKTCQKGLHQYYPGVRRGCPECAVAGSLAWRAANHDKDAETARAYYAAHPGKYTGLMRAWRAANPKRNAENQQAWHATHPGRHAELTRAWKVAHPEERRESFRRRRARKRNNGADVILPADLAALLRFQEGRCAYCAKPLDETKHLDHVIPITRGGGHFLSNLAWACPRCNLSKNSKTATEFRTEQEAR